jgi:hypothetical protein
LKKQFGILILGIAMLASACATYYQKLADFNKAFEQGDLKHAQTVLSKDKKAGKGINRLLFYMNSGTVAMLQGNYAESNVHFNQADLIIEDYQVNRATQALTLVSNPMTQEYRAEDFEKVLIHYYKAINYVQLYDYDAALVECRRLNLKLNQLNDKYTKKNRYSVDAFGLNLMGIIYEASGDINNAFIAYRNAYNAYESTYVTQFQVPAPLQLKKDLIHAAYANGFIDEAENYEAKFGIKHEARKAGTSDLIFFWNNGLGPVKAESSINFSIIRGEGGMVTFANEDLGISFPFPISSGESTGSGLGDLEFVRVAFPKYDERKPLYQNAVLMHGTETVALEKAEDINAIAFKTLNDRMLREMGSSLLRLATKKAAEYTARKENEEFGAVIGMINAVTEKADTRNWQTLPHSINYARMSLPPGEQELSLQLETQVQGMKSEHKIKVDAKAGKTIFHTFQSFETIPSGGQY